METQTTPETNETPKPRKPYRAPKGPRPPLVFDVHPIDADGEVVTVAVTAECIAIHEMAALNQAAASVSPADGHRLAARRVVQALDPIDADELAAVGNDLGAYLDLEANTDLAWLIWEGYWERWLTANTLTIEVTPQTKPQQTAPVEPEGVAVEESVHGE